MQLVAIGSITVDIVVSGMPAELARGDKQEVGSIDLYLGGGALNATASFMEQGESVRLLGALGRDGLGERLRAQRPACRGQRGAQTATEPDRVRRLVLLDPAVWVPPPRALQLAEHPSHEVEAAEFRR